MLIPKISLRQILLAVTALCFFFPILSFAVRGHLWAIAIAIAVGTAIVMVVLYEAFYAFAWLLTLGSSMIRWMVGKPDARLQSPFAGDRLPPVLVSPPPDPED